MAGRRACSNVRTRRQKRVGNTKTTSVKDREQVDNTDTTAGTTVEFQECTRTEIAAPVL